MGLLYFQSELFFKSYQKRDNQSELIEEINRAEDRISFLHTESEYEIIFESGNISLGIKKSPSDPENCHPALRPGWLENVLLPKLIKMANNSEQNKTGFPPTLSLIDKASYQAKYNYLKEKYGKNLVADWPEVTDPQKFVFEDIAIAAYLLTVFSKSHNRPVRFIDIGCGNGLLVYLLVKEGHIGKGIDIRRRNIWSRFEGIDLVEEAVKPENHFDNIDWILGNHTDELTPWIPVIAARSKANFWLLPCCFFDFFSKWNNDGKSSSQYQNYLEFIRSICLLNFETEWDAMRIPSTKRICFVGQFDSNSNLDKIDALLKEKEKFKPRDIKAEMKPRNCQSVSHEVKNEMMKEIVEFLVEHETKENKFATKIEQIVKIFDQARLKKLKSECGGIQTLMKNNKQLLVVEKGTVRIRNWKIGSDEKWNPNPNLYKTRICNFIRFHPNGCPRDPSDCPFAHNESEKVKVDFDKIKRRKV